MIKRRIIHIDKKLCNGCGLCVNACHEGAIGMKDGKAYLVRDDYCDGLGDCLPVCPTGAISFIEKQTLPFNEEEVKKNMAKKQQTSGCPGSSPKSISSQAPQTGCPGSSSKSISSQDKSAKASQAGCPGSMARAFKPAAKASAPATPTADDTSATGAVSMLGQWPVQLKLVPVKAPYFNDARLLIAADCTAFACADFHQRFMKGRITLIGCPKLDEGDYSQKLTQILMQNDIKSVTVVKMEVPCCTGLMRAAVTALQNSGKMIPWSIVTLSLNGEVLED